MNKLLLILAITTLLFIDSYSSKVHVNNKSSIKNENQKNEYLEQVKDKKIIINDDFTSQSIGKLMWFYEDNEKVLSINDVCKPEFSLKYKKSDKDIPYFGYKNSSYWMRFSIINNTNTLKQLFLEISYPLLYKISLYTPGGNSGYTVKLSGNGIAFNNREIAEPTNLFELIIKPNQEITYYCLIESKGVDLTIPISLSTQKKYQHSSKQNLFFSGLYYGILFLMILINLFYLINLKDRAYLYYILYVLFLGLFLLARDGLAFQYFWPNNPVWANNADVTFALLSIIAMLLFVKTTLKTKIFLPIYNKLIIYSIFGFSVLLITSLILSPFYAIGNYSVAFTILLVYLVSIPSLKHDIPIALYFIIGISFLVIGVVIFILKNFGFFSYHTGEIAIKTGSVIDIIILSLGLTVRFKTILKKSQNEALKNLEKINQIKDKINVKLDKINIKLEEEVKKRTTELENRNIKLEEVSKALQKRKDEIQSQKDLLEISNIELEQLSLVARETDNAIAIFNHKMDLEWLNRGFVKLTGFSFDEILKNRGTKLYNISDNTDIKNIVNKCVSEKNSVVYNTKSVTKDNRKVWVRTTLTPIFDDNGKLEKLIAIDADITKLVLAEQEINQRQEEIKAQHNEIEKQNISLEKAYIKVKESARLKEIFLANTSHEIRTPLNGILGFTNLLLKSELKKKQLSYIQNIKTSGDNLLVVIDDILDFSKIEADKLTIEKVDFSLNRIIEQLIKNLKIKSDEKNISLIHRIDSKIPDILVGDPVRLNQILINLIGNAIKFTHNEGKVNLNVKLVKKSKSHLEVAFKIIDNGIGISKDKLKDIFESFTQAKSDTTRKFGGTGLGLSIVKRLVELQKGKIDVKSKINSGTTFTFILTFEIGKTMYPKEITQTRIGIGKCHPKDIKILLVEDNEINQQLAVDTIHMWNEDFIVDIAPNGQIAVDMFQKTDYNLIFMDIQMPVMDGYDTTVFIRKQFSQPKSNTPIIAMTAHAMQHEKEKCIKIGMNDYISKPFIPEDLYNKIKMYTCYKVVELIQKNKSFNINNIFCTATEFIESKITKNKPAIISNEINFKHIDLSKLLKIYNYNNQKVQKIIQMYVDSVPSEMKELRNAFELKNWQVLRAKAHTLKPKMGYIGLNKSFDELKTIEINSENQNNIKEIKELIKNVENAWKKAEKELKKFLS
ncbi:MAG: response regulator [Bacteroidales bacterium]|nr:response regulator [Bacteroidales bacterium]